MKYALFDDTNEICGRYDSEIHGKDVPENAIEITDAIFYQTISENDGVWIRNAENGEICKYPFPPPGAEQIHAQKIELVQRYMDSAAQKLNYDSIANAITYAEEPAVPKFQAEGRGFRAWRSLVWAKCYEILDGVQTGMISIPTDEELIAALPSLTIEEP
ncbi:MAG: hypothetical protein WBF88_07250 [Pusillimonas sp.]